MKGRCFAQLAIYSNSPLLLAQQDIIECLQHLTATPAVWVGARGRLTARRVAVRSVRSVALGQFRVDINGCVSCFAEPVLEKCQSTVWACPVGVLRLVTINAQDQYALACLDIVTPVEKKSE